MNEGEVRFVAHGKSLGVIVTADTDVDVVDPVWDRRSK
jgi:hypothetical protein